MNQNNVPMTWLARHEEGGQIVLRIGRCGKRLVAEWPKAARFEINADGSDIELYFNENLEESFRERLLNGPIRAFQRQLEGKLSLHAAAVGNHQGAVLLLGSSGQGKSTLAAAACVHHHLSLISDDVCHLHLCENATPSDHHKAPSINSSSTTPSEASPSTCVMVEALDSFHSLSLESKIFLNFPSPFRQGHKDHQHVKELVETPSGSEWKKGEKVEVKAVVALDFFLKKESNGPSSHTKQESVLRPIRMTELLTYLVPAVGRLMLDDPDTLKKELGLFTPLLTVPRYKLCRPRDLGKLRESSQLIASLIS